MCGKCCGIASRQMSPIDTDPKTKEMKNMTIHEGARLAGSIRQKLGEMDRLCKGLSEETASDAPEGRWSPKQIISHLCGPEGVGHLPALRLILEQDTPLIDLKAEDPFFTGRRTNMSMPDLLAEFRKEYLQIAELVAGLSGEQLVRKAHIPMLKETGLGEYPTLAKFIGGLIDYHMDFHIKHMQEILQSLGVKQS